jgi:hypothetical protein
MRGVAIITDRSPEYCHQQTAGQGAMRFQAASVGQSCVYGDVLDKLTGLLLDRPHVPARLTPVVINPRAVS